MNKKANAVSNRCTCKEKKKTLAKPHRRMEAKRSSHLIYPVDFPIIDAVSTEQAHYASCQQCDSFPALSINAHKPTRLCFSDGTVPSTPEFCEPLQRHLINCDITSQVSFGFFSTSKSTAIAT